MNERSELSIWYIISFHQNVGRALYYFLHAEFFRKRLYKGRLPRAKLARKRYKGRSGIFRWQCTQNPSHKAGEFFSRHLLHQTHCTIEPWWFLQTQSRRSGSTFCADAKRRSSPRYSLKNTGSSTATFLLSRLTPRPCGLYRTRRRAPLKRPLLVGGGNAGGSRAPRRE